MENHGRRNRRGRERRSRQYIATQSFVIPNAPKSSSLLNGITSLFIMSSLIAIIYLMLDYHCTACHSKMCDFTNITKNIDEIAFNISRIEESYYDLETKVIRFSHELPKIGGKIELLESIANTGSGDFCNTEQPTRSYKKIDVLPNRCGYEPNVIKCNVTKKHKNSLNQEY